MNSPKVRNTQSRNTSIEKISFFRIKSTGGGKKPPKTNKKPSKIKALSAEIKRLNGKLDEISKRKEALRYKNVLLQKKLSRTSKVKLCNSKLKKLESIICKERNKVSDCLKEIEALKNTMWT